jgi:hypothetical protein
MTTGMATLNDEAKQRAIDWIGRELGGVSDLTQDTIRAKAYPGVPGRSICSRRVDYRTAGFFGAEAVLTPSCRIPPSVFRLLCTSL